MTTESTHNPQRDSGTASVARGAGVTFVGHLTGRVLGFLLTLFLTRWLGASDFGLFILALAIVQCVSLFADMGLKHGALRFVAIAEGRNDHAASRQVVVTVLQYSLIASLVGMVVLIASTSLLADWFRQPAFWWLIPVLAVSLPFATVGTVLTSVLQGFKRLAAVAGLQNVVDPLIRIGVFLSLAFLGWGIGAAVASQVAAVVCVCAAALIWLIPRMPSARDRVSRINEKEILAFSVPLSLAHLASLTMQWADSLFLGFFTTARDVGIYGAASRMAALGGMTLLAVNISFGPHANELYGRGDLKGVQQLYGQVTRWLIMLNLPILILTLAFAHPLLGLFGSEFRTGWPVLLILAGATFINVATGPAGGVALMAGRSKIVLLAGVLLTALNIALHWTLVPRWGIVGASIATAMTVAVSNVTNVLLGWFFLGLQPYGVNVVKPLMIGAGATVLTAVVASAVQVESMQGILFFLLIWAVVYPISLMQLVADSEDRAAVRSLLTRASLVSWGGR